MLVRPSSRAISRAILFASFPPLALAACSHAAPPAARAADPEPEVSLEASPPPPIASIDWIGSADEAKARAADEGRPMIVFVRASWSEPSVIMDQTIWKDARVLREAPRFIALRIDVTHGAMKAVPDDVAKEYGVESIPTTLVVNTDGSVVARFGLGLARAADVADAMKKAR